MTTPADPPRSDAERIARLRLARTDGVGPATWRRLIERCGSAIAALDALPDLARRGGRRDALRPPGADVAEREMASAAALGATHHFLGDPAYPDLLAAIEDAPPVLVMMGDASLAARTCVAVVGARNASAAGVKLTEMIARDLGAAGIVVVSGMARGIDAAAHRAALETGTIAALAGGIDVVYPPENEALQRRTGEVGLLMAEFPPGLRPTARHFPRRNRIVSGLARGVVVVEAATGSGSLITARMAGDQGRDVFAVPGSPLDPRCRGTNDLIRQGAVLTESAGDVLAALDLAPRRPVRSEPQPMPGPAPTDEVERCRAFVIERLGPTPVDVDDLLRQGELTPSILSTILLELELAGRLRRHSGNRISWA